MRIVKKITNKANDKHCNKTPIIAFLGDSITQGCFETASFGTDNCDCEAVYHNKLKQMIYSVCPNTVIDIVNAGIGGDNAVKCLERLERDVIKKSPDLCVVCFGLNDVNGKEEGLIKYTNALENIFKSIKEHGSEVIFMTPNMLNTYVSNHIIDERLNNYAEITAQYQNSGLMDMYMNSAKKIANKNNIKICDCYLKWKKMHECGIDTTALLSNGINHPTREMHNLFATALFNTIFFDA